MLELLLAASMLYPPPSTMARGVHPAAWACSALELFDAPAGLSRLTAAGVHGWALAFENGPADAGVAGGLPLFDGRVAVGAAAAAGSDFGSYALAAGASYVLTGDPIGFMEGLFGPSIVVGVSGGAVKTGGGPGPFATASVQFSVFPSFAMGAAVHWREGQRPEPGLGFTHVFNRAFSMNAGYSDGDPQVGAVLKVSGNLSVSAGTGDGRWHSGAAVGIGSFIADFSVSLSEDEVSGGAGLSWRPRW